MQLSSSVCAVWCCCRVVGMVDSGASATIGAVGVAVWRSIVLCGTRDGVGVRAGLAFLVGVGMLVRYN